MLLTLCIILTSCGIDNNTGSYEGILIVNGEEYSLRSSDNSLEIGGFIGEIVSKVKPQNIPQNNFESNMLERGTKLYRSPDNKNAIIAITEEDRFIFIKRK